MPLIRQWTCLYLLLFVSFSLLASAVSPQGEALLSWKWALNGSVEALSSWNGSDFTPCGWFGVSCNANMEIVELNLRYVDLFGYVPSNLTALKSLSKLVLIGTNLTGPIPREIGNCHQLSYLDLSDNSLIGEIPAELGRLGKLEILLINSNRLEGAIPMEIGNLTRLRWLVLYDNQLSGAIPSSIGNLKGLEVLRAGGNKNLVGPLPMEIGNCSNLIMLGLAETSMSGFLPSSLGLLKKLQSLAIYTALLSGQLPAELGDCTSLQSIYLYENSLSGSMPTRLGNLRNLKNLLLWQNNLVGVIPPELGNCRQLMVIDLSMNLITGSIPQSLGNLTLLQELQLSMNQISGRIPTELSNCQGLTHLELDNNQISGIIPPELGRLTNLTLLYLWQNKLEGNIPSSLSQCSILEAVDLSQNSLVGAIPNGIFNLKNLNKLLLLSNNLSGEIPPEVGNSEALVRLRANDNKIAGKIPPEIGKLQNLNFLDLGSNHLTGAIPPELFGCRNLTFLDLHSNSISGSLPPTFGDLVSLQFVDLSDNQIEGSLTSDVGSLTSLTKLVLAKNKISGMITPELGKCIKLQLVDLSSNGFSGEIPQTLGQIPALEIALNLSFNNLSGAIPAHFSNLERLAVLDLSHNGLSDGLQFLSGLQNLVSLNISYNDFSGRVPYTPFFAKLPVSDLDGNPNLCLAGGRCSAIRPGSAQVTTDAARVAMIVLLCTASALLMAALFIFLKGRRRGKNGAHENGCEDDTELGPPWELTLFQKLDLSIDDVIKCLTAGNVIGKGWSGVVYRATLPAGHTIAVKRFRSSKAYSASAFSSEIATLARIRHRNIVRLIGWGSNRKTRLLFYDYMPNGTLGALLHDAPAAGGAVVEWETRLKIAQGVAEGLAYLHHDCVPAIMHRDVKAYNILLADRYEPCLADFGLAQLVESQDGSQSAGAISANNPRFAGSYGYIAPEYGCMLKITEKSDVYSFGVVLLEIITGKEPVDPSFPEGQHVAQWVREHLRSKKDPVEIIDPKLQGRPDSQIQEMLQALGISLLCASNRADDRPSMKDVAALLREIRHEPSTGSEPSKFGDDSCKRADAPSYSSLVTPAQFLLQGSSHCSIAYSSSSGGISRGRTLY
ncbi:leucine-rich repeat receptor-like serine/threonine-protein kinase RGI4 [Aristolochia californica]|uniref:leucine-rich repeat receptor-like serine/threonine-protein kinase RGI4 n=1 Tax=Aristolochia californica TaxID=171875 RepID=UPI0035DE2D32